MADKKLVILVEQLKQKSLEGKIEWNETPNEGQFSVSFPNHSITLSLKPTKIPDEHTYSDAYDVVLTIINSDGEIIEEIRDIDFSKGDFDGGNAYSIMLELYSMVRRKAMGMDDAVNSILAELTKDDTPF